MRPAGRALAALVAVGAVGAGGVLAGRWVADEVRGPACRFTAGEAQETLSPEQSANAATIAMVGVERGLRGRAVTIALATAMQESKLRNLTYGDADSLGLFQQRPSQGWGSEEEVLDPVYAATAFYDVLEDVPGWQDGALTEVAQAVQRSAYPDAYAQHEEEAQVLAAVLTGQVPGGIGCRLDEAGAGSAADVVAKARDAFGLEGTVDGDTAVLPAADADDAWAVASWAVAHADAEDVVRVQVGDAVWDRAEEPLSWAETGQPATGGPVRVTVG